MRFHADDRLLELLVGSNLYPSPDVCLRELVQNAWDAIELRRASGEEVEGHIVVRYSMAGRYFEVEDNGIGMNAHDIEESFLSVGRDKLEALGTAGQAGEQIAFFGIGVLSVFLVAESIEVETRKVSEERGLKLRIESLKDERDPEEVPRVSVGTNVRVEVREGAPFELAGVPDAVRNYARHVRGVFVEDVDTGRQVETEEQWDTEGLLGVGWLNDDERVRDGRVGFLSTLTNDQPVVSNRFTLCNGGFLVESNALDLLHINPLGFAGELDLHANALSVVMARERFQRNDRWLDLGRSLVDDLEGRALVALDSGFLSDDSGLEPAQVRRCLFIWHSALRDAQAFDDLKAAVRKRIMETLPFPLAGTTRTETLAGVLERLPEPRLYFRRVGGPEYRSRQIDDEGLPINLNEEIQYGIRVGALRARGFPVIETSVFYATWQTYQQAQPHTVSVDEVQVIIDCLGSSGVTLMDVSQAPDTDLDFDDFERLPVLRRVLNVGGEQLRLASVPESSRRVVNDPSGVRYLNVDSPGVRRLLTVLPDAIANPLKRRLLRVYLGLESFEFAEARNTLLELLEDKNLALSAQVQTSVLTKGATRRVIERLLAEQEKA